MASTSVRARRPRLRRLLASAATAAALLVAHAAAAQATILAAGEPYVPQGLAYDPTTHTVYSASGGSTTCRVLSWKAGGRISLVAGAYGCGDTGDGGPATAALIEPPTGLAVDASHNVYVAAQYTVRRVSHASGVISDFAGNARYPCLVEGEHEAEVGSIASQVGIYVEGIATDPVSGHLFVTDVCDHAILEIDESGVIVGRYGSAYPDEARGPLAFDAAGDLYFGSGTYDEQVRKMDPEGHFSLVAGDGTEGIGGNGGPAVLAELDEVVGLAVNSRGVLLISTSGPLRNYIRQVSREGTIDALAGAEWPGTHIASPGTLASEAVFWHVGQIVVNDDDETLVSDSNDRTLFDIERDDPSALVTLLMQENIPILGDERLGGGNPSESTCDQGCVGDPVSTATGEYSETTTDLAIPGRGPALALSRTYGSLSAADEGPFGHGWTGSYFMSASLDEAGVVTIRQENGSELHFEPNGRGGFLGSSAYAARLVANEGGGWTLTRREREQFAFDAAGHLVSEQDLNGVTTTLSYERGRLRRVTDPAGRSFTLSYGGEGHVSEVADSTGRIVRYGYASGDLTSVVDARGKTWTYAYDGEHRLERRTDPNRHVDVANRYDSDERVVQQTDGREGVTRFTYRPGMTQITSPGRRVRDDYYAGGELVQRVDAAGTAEAATWSYEYEPVTYGTTKVTDPNGNVWTATYDAAGLRTSTTDPLEDATSSTYDELGDRLTFEDANHVTTTWTYDEHGNLLRSSTPVGGEETQVTTFSHGDAEHPGDVTAIEDPRGKTTELGYDAAGDLTSITDATGDETTMTYDEAGDLATVVSPRGNAAGGRPEHHTTTYAHDAAGALTQVTDPLGNVTRRAYDPAGNLESTTDPKRQATTYDYDEGDLLTAIHRPGGTTLRRGYDAEGALTSTTDGAAHATRYAYDDQGRLRSVTDPDERTTSYAYDRAGDLSSMVDPQRRTTTYAYDEANRLRAVSYSDRTTPNVTFGYDADGQRTSMSDGTGSSSFVYDALHRLTEQSDAAGSVRYGYDLANDLTSITYPNSETVSRTFDDAGRLESVTDWLRATTRFTYDADSELLRTTFPAAAEDVDASVYGDAGELSSSTFKHGATTLASLAYRYDEDGLPTQTEQTGLPGSATVRSTYTALGQLASSDGHGYEYDSADDVTQLAGARTLRYDSANELREGPVAPGSEARPATFGYDGDGNRASATPAGGSATRYGYDQADRLVSFTPPTGTSATYGYDGEGLRLSKTIGRATTLYGWDRSGGLPLLLSDATNSYIYGPDGLPFEQLDGSGHATYLHHDELGSTRLLTGEGGTASATFSYAPFGTLTGSTGRQTTPLGFAGEYTDAESGLQYLRARYTDPATGQFLTRDPLAAVTGQPYAYAGDDPLAATDPSGLLSLQQLATAYVGLVDGVTLDSTSDIRGIFGLDGGLDTCSVGYQIAHGVGTGGSLVALALTTDGLGDLAFAGETGAAAEEGATASTSFGRLIQDFQRGDGWTRVSAHVERATGRAYKGATSIEEVFERSSGEQLVRHRIYDQNGEMLHETFRPYAKFGLP
jgi:RHS repeat-associated protein